MKDQRRTNTETSLFETTNSTTSSQAMLVQTSKTSLPQIQKASHVHLNSFSSTNSDGAKSNGRSLDCLNISNGRSLDPLISNGDVSSSNTLDKDHEMALRPKRLGCDTNSTTPNNINSARIPKTSNASSQRTNRKRSMAVRTAAVIGKI